ncbi:MAG: hypothetical protein P8Y43_05980 [Sulfurovaceae bacterium]
MNMFAITLFIGILSSILYAGGDYVLVDVQSFEEQKGIVKIKIKQIDDRDPLMKGCFEFEVAITHKRVPWFSWLPFMKSSHPTKKENQASLGLLLEAYQDKVPTNFGYMGYGLAGTEKECSFVSYGLKTIKTEEGEAVLSFYSEI